MRMKKDVMRIARGCCNTRENSKLQLDPGMEAAEATFVGVTWHTGGYQRDAWISLHAARQTGTDMMEAPAGRGNHWTHFVPTQPCGCICVAQSAQKNSKHRIRRLSLAGGSRHPRNSPGIMRFGSIWRARKRLGRQQTSKRTRTRTKTRIVQTFRHI
jgi:hypothetical protein